jgi:CRP-like cAMP-binding protein
MATGTKPVDRRPSTLDPRPLTGERRPAASRPKNKLLACLPREDYERLRPHLTTVLLKPKQVLHPANEPIRHVFFLNDGVASITTVMKNRAMVEIATVGDEGFVGINAVFGAEMLCGETMLQVPVANATAEMLSIEIFKRELGRPGPFQDGLQRYSQGLLMLMMQATGCMALHSVPARCCRWLLMVHDRVRTDEFRLSHEFLAMMLGATRPTVTTVAGTLQKAGLIKYTHGRITIVNRQKLEAGSCECYGTLKGHFDRLGL